MPVAAWDHRVVLTWLVKPDADMRAAGMSWALIVQQIFVQEF